MTRRILVTGAGGFIGGEVARQLKSEGVEVFGMFHGSASAQRSDPDLFSAVTAGEVTLTSLQDFASGVEEIYHCAGSGSVARSLEEPIIDFDSNVLTTRNVLEFARLSGGIRIALPSSAGVYGNTDSLPIRISASCQPISPYGTNKLIAEMLAQQYAKSFSIPVTIIRLFSVYGPGLRKQLLWDASRKLLAKNTSFFGTGQETRDWIYVSDAASLMITACRATSSGCMILNGGTGQAVEIRHIVEGLAERLGVSDRICFNGDVRKGDPQHFQADISEALATGWSPQIDLEAGLTSYVNWFLSQVSAAPC